MNIEHLSKLVRHPIREYKKIKDAMLFEVSFINIFIEQEYLWLMNKIKSNTTVLDIGGFIGDTALYFAASPKVKKVITFEPNRMFYDRAVHLVEISQYKEKIELINMGISHDGRSRIMKREYDAEFLKDSEEGVGQEIMSLTLNDALSELKNVVIKCDIEGAEEYIFNDANLEEVYAMELECHYQNEPRVAKILEKKGFNCKLGPRKYKDWILLRCER